MTATPSEGTTYPDQFELVRHGGAGACGGTSTTGEGGGAFAFCGIVARCTLTVPALARTANVSVTGERYGFAIAGTTTLARPEAHDTVFSGYSDEKVLCSRRNVHVLAPLTCTVRTTGAPAAGSGRGPLATNEAMTGTDGAAAAGEVVSAEAATTAHAATAASARVKRAVMSPLYRGVRPGGSPTRGSRRVC